MIKIIEDVDVLKEVRERLRNEGEYDYVGPPSEFGTLVVKENNKCFHICINENRKAIRFYKKRYEYEDAGSFSDGLAWVRKNGKEFHIKLDGKPAYKERYNWVGSFSNGITRVRKDKKDFHIGTNGKPLYEERYDQVTMFKDGVARVKIGKQKHFFIDLDGKKTNQT